MKEHSCEGKEKKKNNYAWNYKFYEKTEVIY